MVNRLLLTASLSSNDETATKTSLENKHLGNGHYFVINGGSTSPFAACSVNNEGCREEAMKKMHRMKDLLLN